ncbi:MAG: DUF4390 domain-containing protein [Acidiferrobacterales bacterium]
MKINKLFLAVLFSAIVFNLNILDTVLADFTVIKPGAELVNKNMELSGQLRLDLSAKVEEALDKGIPLAIEVEYRLFRIRKFIWDDQVANWSFTHSIQYHALSRQYLVRGHGLDDSSVESFTTLQEALSFMGSLDGLVLPLPQQLEEISDAKNNPGYRVQVRARLVIEALPAPLRPVAYTSGDWRLNTGWVSWKIAR